MSRGRDAAAAEIESRVVSPPEESPDGAACLEALQEADGYEGYSNLELGSSDSFLLSPSKAKLRIKARGLKRPRTLALEVHSSCSRIRRKGEKAEERGKVMGTRAVGSKQVDGGGGAFITGRLVCSGIFL